MQAWQVDHQSATVAMHCQRLTLSRRVDGQLLRLTPRLGCRLLSAVVERSACARDSTSAGHLLLPKAACGLPCWCQMALPLHKNRSLSEHSFVARRVNSTPPKTRGSLLCRGTWAKTSLECKQDCPAKGTGSYHQQGLCPLSPPVLHAVCVNVAPAPQHCVPWYTRQACSTVGRTNIRNWEAE